MDHKQIQDILNALDRVINEKDQLQAENQSFSNVFAIIHRDGGHYITKHGHKKASEDAIAIISKLKEELGRYKAADNAKMEITKASEGGG